MIDLVAVQRAVNMLAKRAGLRVEYVDKQRFATEPGGRLIIQRPALNWTESQLRVWRNAVCHEIGHWLPEVRDIFPLLVKKKINTSDIFGACLNIVDDVRNDRNRCEEYPGTRQDKIFTTEYLMSANWIPMIVKGDFNKDIPNRITNTMVCASVGVLAMIDPVLHKTYSAVETVLDAEQQAWIATLESDGWMTRWLALETAQEEWQYVTDVLKEVFKLPDEEVNEMADRSQQEGEDESDQESDSDSDGDGEGDGEGESEDSSEDEGEEKKKRKKNIVTVKYEQMLGQKKHDRKQKSMGGIHIDYTTYSGGGYDPHTPETTKIGTAKEVLRAAPGAWETKWIIEAISKSNVDAIANQARRFLQAETRKNYAVNMRQGKLDTRKLTKLVTHNRESSLSPAIFKQPSQKSALDTCVSVLVDCSGSMQSAAKYPLAVAAAWGMIEICNTLRIPIEVATFTELDYNENVHVLLKTFAQKITKEEIINSGAIAAGHMCANADADNILIAYNRIATRPEPKKLIMVMSDGSPASYRGDCMTYTKSLVKTLEKDHFVDIMGVGILDTNVKLIYKNNYVVHRADQIPAALIEILKNNVTVQK